MKHFFTLIAVLSISILSQGQIQTIEYFENYSDTDDLEIIQTGTEISETDWYLTLKGDYQVGSSPTIEAGALSYSGYIGSEQGNSVILSNAAVNDGHISTKRVYSSAITDNLYAAFLVNIETARTGFNDIFTWEASTSSNFPRGRIFVSATDEGDLSFGISKNSTSQLTTQSGYALNTTYLIVLKYEKVGSEDDGDDDIVKIYINPDISLTASENTSLTNIDSKTDYDSDNTNIAINIRQNRVGATISSIRTSTTWDGLWSGTTDIYDNSKATKSTILIYDNFITNNETQDGIITIYNLSGSTCLTQSIASMGTIAIDLPNGVYVVKFKGTDNSVLTTKALIR